MRLIIAALLLLLALPATAQDLLDHMSGRWGGEGHDPVGSWAITLEVDRTGARVWYPTFPCAARWDWDAAPTQTALTGTERLTQGHALCADGLRVQLEPLENGRLSVAWLTDREQVVGSAELTRKSP